jgi:hypothetical protein
MWPHTSCRMASLNRSADLYFAVSAAFDGCEQRVLAALVGGHVEVNDRFDSWLMIVNISILNLITGIRCVLM